MGKNKGRLKLHLEYRSDKTASFQAIITGMSNWHEDYLSVSRLHLIYNLPSNDFFFKKTIAFLENYRKTTPSPLWLTQGEIQSESHCVIGLHIRCNTRSEVQQLRREIFEFFAPIAEFCDKVMKDTELEVITQEWVDAENKKALGN